MKKINKELKTLIRLKYGPLSLDTRYITSLPECVCRELYKNWPFITIDDVYTALVEYELGERISSIEYKEFLHRDS